MRQIVQVIREFGTDLLSELPFGPDPEFRCEVLTDRAEIDFGRRFQVELYVKLGKIAAEDVGPDGLLLDDPYHLDSTYFGAYRGRPGPDGRGGDMVAFGRLIWRPHTTAADLRTDPRLVGGEWAERLMAEGPGMVAEEGALAKRRGVSAYAVQKVHQSAISFAEAHGVKYTLGCLEPPVYPFYKLLFGDGMKRMVREPMLFPGILNPLLPVIIDHTYRPSVWRELREGQNPAIVAVRAAGIQYGLRRIVPGLRQVAYRHEDELAARRDAETGGESVVGAAVDSAVTTEHYPR